MCPNPLQFVGCDLLGAKVVKKVTHVLLGPGDGCKPRFLEALQSKTANAESSKPSVPQKVDIFFYHVVPSIVCM